MDNKKIPAFPRPLSGNLLMKNYEDAKFAGEQDGMDLRDYFAAKAMQGFVTSLPNPANYPSDSDIKDLAEYSYKVADAMLKERE